MNNDKKIEWLLFHSNVLYQKISDGTGIDVRTLKNYRRQLRINNNNHYEVVADEDELKLLDFIKSLKEDDVLDNEYIEHQILVQGSSEHIEKVFTSYKFAVQLNWIKEYKEGLFIVNFGIRSKKQFNRYPYDLKELIYTFSREDYDRKVKLANFIRAVGKEINFGGSRTLYEVDGKEYQVIIDILDDNPYRVTQPLKVRDIIETDVFIEEN